MIFRSALCLLFMATVSFASMPDDYILYYNMDDGQIADSSANGFDPQNTYNLATTEDRHGNATGATYFNGTHAYAIGPNEDLLFGNTPPVATSMFTWVKFDTVRHTYFLNTYYSTSGNDDRFLAELRLHMGDHGLAQASRIRSGGYNIDTVLPMNGVNDVMEDLWYHVGFTLDQANQVMTAYLNGQAVGIATGAQVPANADYTEGDPLMIGATWFQGALNSPLHGAMDDIVIYDRELSASEVNALFLDDPSASPIPLPAAVFAGSLMIGALLRRRHP